MKKRTAVVKCTLSIYETHCKLIFLGSLCRYEPVVTTVPYSSRNIVDLMS